MTIKEEITNYILQWTPVSDAVASPRQDEVNLLHEALEELVEQDNKLREFKTKAGVWQQKFSQCKAEITILRQRKGYYKREFLRLKATMNIEPEGRPLPQPPVIG